METIKEIEQHFIVKNIYPDDASLWQKGEAVFEFPFIIKLDNNNFVVHSQRHYATNPFLLAEHAEWKFNNLFDAYTKWYNLEHGIF